MNEPFLKITTKFLHFIMSRPRRKGGNKCCFCLSVRLSVRHVRSKLIIRVPKGLVCRNLERKFPTLEVTLGTILQVRWPNQQCHSTEGWWLVNRSRANPTTLNSLKGKVITVTIRIAPWRLKTQDRELNQAKSKPDPVDQPVRTARKFVHHYNSTQPTYINYSVHRTPCLVSYSLTVIVNTCQLACGFLISTGSQSVSVLISSWP